MAVDLYQSVDRSKVDSLPFLKGSYPFGYIDSDNKNRLGVIFEIGPDDCKKMRALLKGKQERTIVKGDRVFVLSGCKVPRFKIKEFCRGLGAVMVNDIEDATVFVGNEKVYQEHDVNNCNTLDSRSMIMEMTYINAEDDTDLAKFCELEVDPVVKDYYKEPPVKARFTRMLSAYKSGSTIGGARNMLCITPYTARVVYSLLASQIVTINEDCLYKQLPTSSVLDKRLFEQTMAMMNSADEANRKVAHEILANSDHKDADLYLYQIAKKHYHEISSSKFKNIRLFTSESNLYQYYAYSDDEFLNHLTTSKKLSREALDLLLPTITKAAYQSVTNNKSSIFSIKLELRPDLAAILGDHEYNKEIEPGLNIQQDVDAN